MGLIVISEEEVGTNADMLAGTRLESVPGMGSMRIELSAADCIAANHYVITIQLGSDVPLDSVLVPGAATVGATGLMNELDSLSFTLPVQKADKVLMSCVETGDTELFWRVTYLGD
jgi:hypothetical protein